MAAPSSGQPAPKGNVLTQKLWILPVWAWLLIVTGVAIGFYYIVNRNKTAAASTADTGGTAQVPDTIIQNIEPGQPIPPGTPAPTTTGNPPPPPGSSPPPPPPPGGGKRGGGGTGPPTRLPGPKPKTKEITVRQDMTFAQMAREYHWTPATIKAIEDLNQIQGRGRLSPRSRLKRGQVILRPIK